MKTIKKKQTECKKSTFWTAKTKKAYKKAGNALADALGIEKKDFKKMLSL